MKSTVELIVARPSGLGWLAHFNDHTQPGQLLGQVQWPVKQHVYPMVSKGVNILTQNFVNNILYNGIHIGISCSKSVHEVTPIHNMPNHLHVY